MNVNDMNTSNININFLNESVSRQVDINISNNRTFKQN